MAWNEPGGDKQDDPWSGRRNGQGPPDLDEVVRKMQEKLGGIFGRKSAGTPGKGRGVSFGFIALIILLLWAASGIYIVDPAEKGVVLRFGRYVDTTSAGPHWHIPFPIEAVRKVDVEQIRNVEIGFRSGSTTSRGTNKVPQESLMLTRDENIVDAKFAVQYRISDARSYLFHVRDPDSTLQQATESAVREITGKSNMDFILTEGRSDIALRSEKLIQEILDRYETGLVVIDVNMQDAQPPDEVQEAFSDAVKAREDKQRLINEAEAYSNDILPKARGAAARQVAEADAYKGQVTAEAEGDVSRFLDVLGQYKKAPDVTRERLYIESVESVLKNSSKILVNAKSGNQLLYLPIDRIIEQGTEAERAKKAQTSSSTETPPEKSDSSQDDSRSQRSTDLRTDLRRRETR